MIYTTMEKKWYGKPSAEVVMLKSGVGLRSQKNFLVQKSYTLTRGAVSQVVKSVRWCRMRVGCVQDSVRCVRNSVRCVQNSVRCVLDSVRCLLDFRKFWN